MGVFGVFFGCRGVIGFNGCCSGVSSGDGGFMLACISGRRGATGFTLACIGGRRGVIGFNLATWLCPAREIVRPVNEEWPKIGGLWRAGRTFSRASSRRILPCEFVVPR